MKRANRIAQACLALVACFASLFSIVDANADTPPNVWDAARDPTIRDRYALHLNVRESIQLDRQTSGLGTSSHRAPIMRARVMLEIAHAAESDDVLLRFDLGEVYSLLKDYDRAIEVLGAALELAPDHPAALEALNALANSYANLDRSADEVVVYERFLSRATDERSRAVAMLNLAEAEMHLGRLSDAIGDYRETIQLATSLPNMIELEDNTGVLAVWGLAVALDRSGDEAGGANQAKLAEQLDPNDRIIGHGANVFFVPSYERLWYLGLGAAERARQASTVKEAVDRWGRVEAIWAKYVEESEKASRTSAKDRWLSQAKAHHDRAATARAAAQKRAGVPVKPPTSIQWSGD